MSEADKLREAIAWAHSLDNPATLASLHLNVLCNARRMAIEECAALVAPKGKKPCDCISLHDDKWWLPSCDCRNGGDSDSAAQWCESMNNATTILALLDKEPA